MKNNFQWYERKISHKYGDYDSKTKRYYNEDSGKWVTQLRDKKRVIEEKYIRYEFSVWDDRQIEEEFGYALVERINRFLYLLYKKTLEVERTNGHRWVYVDSSRICCGILGMHYKEIIQKLYDIDIIDLAYKDGKFGKDRQLYMLADAFFRKDCYRREIYIRNTKLTKFLDKMYGGNFTLGDERDEFIKWEINSFKRVEINRDADVEMLLEIRLNQKKDLEFEKKDWDFLSKQQKEQIKKGWDTDRVEQYFWKGRLRFEQLRVELSELKRGGSSFKGFDRDKFSGRYYNIINQKEREFRKALKLDGENLIEVDMVNGYVSLIYRIFKGVKTLSKNKDSFSTYLQKVIGDVDFSDFLEKYKVCFEGPYEERKDFYDLIGVELLNIKSVGLFAEESHQRKYMKELVLYLINGEKGDGMKRTYIDEMYTYDEIMHKIFCKGGYEAIERIKNTEFDFQINNEKKYYGYQTYKYMSKLLMNMEVIIMRGVWRQLIENQIPYLSLFDGMMIKKRDLSRVLGIAEQYLMSGLDSCIRFKVKKNEKKVA